MKPIRTQADHKAALSTIESLMNAQVNTPDGDRLDVLVTLVETYERAHFPMDLRAIIDDAVVAAEIAAMSVVAVAKTADRSVTGQMVDFAKHLTYYLPENGWSEPDLRVAEGKLAQMPCRASGPFDKVIFPQDAALRLLAGAWSGRGVRH